MVLSEAEGLLRIAMADLETAEASTDLRYSEGEPGASGCSRRWKRHSRLGCCTSGLRE
jgi:hypothetical protein